MSYQLIGAVLIFSGCGGFGFSIAAGYKAKEKMLRQLVRMLQFMECELKYRQTSLPELCRHAAQDINGPVKNALLNFSRELDWQTAADAYSCMKSAVKKTPSLPIEIKRVLYQLGHTMGRFDLDGQLKGLQAVKQVCKAELKRTALESAASVRNYQTLGLCAGAALAILFA